MIMKKLPHLIFVGIFVSCFISYAQPRVPD